MKSHSLIEDSPEEWIVDDRSKDRSKEIINF